MPIIKQTQTGDFHVIRAVEFVKFGASLAWRAKYQSFKLPDALRPTGSGELLDVPVALDISDPISAFESACVNQPGGVLHGGDVVDSPSAETVIGLERSAAWSRVRTARDTHLAAGCATPHGHFDTDLTSIVNLLGATASMQEGESMPWILQDHSVVVLTKSQLLAAGRQLAEFRAQVYAHGSAIYQQIQAAESVEAVRAIRWTAP